MAVLVYHHHLFLLVEVEAHLLLEQLPLTLVLVTEEPARLQLYQAYLSLMQVVVVGLVMEREEQEAQAVGATE